LNRSSVFGWFGAITLTSAVAWAQPEVAVPAAPAAAKPANGATDNPYGQAAVPAARPKKKAALLLEAAKAESAKGQPLAPSVQKVPVQPERAQQPPVRAQQPPVQAQSPVPPVASPPPPAPPTPAPEPAHEHAAQPAHENADTHGSPHHEEAGDAHSSPHHEEAHEPPYIDDVNWFYGLLGESDESEPSLLYRPKGMPVPFLATLINWGILVWLIVMLAKKQLPAALAKRKATIVQGMQEAQKARDESAERLRGYEDKLAKIDSEIERIKAEMLKAGEQERDRILAEAVERRSRMERDARRLIETELESIKESLRHDVVQVALRAAKKSIESQVATTDQQRLFDEAMSSLKKLPPRSLGGQT